MTSVAKRAVVQVTVEEYRLSRVCARKAVGIRRSALYKSTTDRVAKDAPRSSRRSAKFGRNVRAGGSGSASSGCARTGAAGTTTRHELNLQRKVRSRLVTCECQPLPASNALKRIWVLDFMRDTLYKGCPFRTLNAIDESNLGALRIECSTSIPSALLNLGSHLLALSRLVHSAGSGAATNV